MRYSVSSCELSETLTYIYDDSKTNGILEMKPPSKLEEVKCNRNLEMKRVPFICSQYPVTRT